MGIHLLKIDASVPSLTKKFVKTSHFITKKTCYQINLTRKMSDKVETTTTETPKEVVEETPKKVVDETKTEEPVSTNDEKTEAKKDEPESTNGEAEAKRTRLRSKRIRK